MLEHFTAVQEGGTGLAQVTQIYLKEIKSRRNLIKAQSPSIHCHCWKLENADSTVIIKDPQSLLISQYFFEITWH